MRLERHISIAWFCFGKSCLSYAIFNFWILSPNNLFICTVTQSNDIVFKFPHGHNAKSKQFQFMDVSISPFFEGIRLVTPSEAWHDNSVTLVTDRKFLKRFTLPVDNCNPEGRGEGEAEFASKYIYQTGRLIT